MLQKLLTAVIAEANSHGTHALETYPVEPDSPSYRFESFIPFSTKAGFLEVGRLGSHHHIMRKELRPSCDGK